MTSHPPSTVSVFPLDLEREIFELSARSRPSTIPTLMLVAWRVKTWVEPLLYGTILLPTRPNDSDTKVGGIPIHDWEAVIDLIQTRPEFLAQSVRGLLLCHRQGVKHQESIELILRACSNVENLWIGSAILAHLLPVLERLPLTHLYCYISDIFGSQQDAHFTHPLFAQITHLELFDTSDYPEDDTFLPEVWSHIVLIPNLTHLAFNDVIFLPLCLTVLQSCHSMCVVVVLLPGGLENEDDDLVSELTKDPRFITMACIFYVKDWQMGRHSGVDYWARAEDLVAKRKCGEINPLQHHLTDETKLITDISTVVGSQM
ncbi:hypothetical protein C8R43DRAFT_1132537 [Mycena crocata]|nr:hypothetical protein C8R43DRAFT_1132537 [Mycena crocata]